MPRQSPEHRHQQVGGRTGHGHPGHVAVRSLKITRVNGHRLGPAEHEPGQGEHAQGHQHGADGIDVLEWVQNDAAEHSRSAVAQAVCHPAVRGLVQGHREDHRQDHDRQLLDKTEFFHRRSIPGYSSAPERPLEVIVVGQNQGGARDGFVQLRRQIRGGAVAPVRWRL